jgi:quinol-cytochrome oxidoreductase complex cytochrome b subunit
MNKKFLLSNKQNDLHIPPLAIFLFIVILAGIILLNMIGATDWQIAYFTFPMMGLLLYILFAVKVASQWEKAVVLRLERKRRFSDCAIFRSRFYESRWLEWHGFDGAE